MVKSISCPLQFMVMRYILFFMFKTQSYEVSKVKSMAIHKNIILYLENFERWTLHSELFRRNLRKITNFLCKILQNNTMLLLKNAKIFLLIKCPIMEVHGAF